MISVEANSCQARPALGLHGPQALTPKLGDVDQRGVRLDENIPRDPSKAVNRGVNHVEIAHSWTKTCRCRRIPWVDAARYGAIAMQASVVDDPGADATRRECGDALLGFSHSFVLPLPPRPTGRQRNLSLHESQGVRLTLTCSRPLGVV